MKKAMKVLGILLCAVLLVVGSVAATLAYLTATSGTVTNTFTVGNVQLTLDEAKVNAAGQPVDNSDKVVALEDAPRVQSNSYHLIASKSYVKDPTVTVSTVGEDKAYVRVMLKVQGTDWTNLSKVLTDYDGTKWMIDNANAVKGEGEDYIVYEFRYYETVGSGKLPALFSGIDVTTSAKYDLVSGLTNIEVEAHAIQADGFDTASAAWAEFNSGTLRASEEPEEQA